MKLKTYFSLQIVVLAIIAFILLPKTVSSCSPFKANNNIKKAETAMVVSEAKTGDIKDELLFRY